MAKTTFNEWLQLWQGGSTWRSKPVPEKHEERVDAYRNMREKARIGRIAGNRFDFGIYDDGYLVGEVSINTIRRSTEQTAFIGYELDRRKTQRGVGSQAVTLAVDYAFTQLGLNEVVAEIPPGNVASVALARKVGFAHVGQGNDHEIDGKRTAHEQWRLGVDEWFSGLRPVQLALPPSSGRGRYVPVSTSQPGISLTLGV